MRLIGVFVFAVVVGLLVGLLGAIITTWPIMLFLGAAHSTNHVVPAFGFWTTFFLTLAFAWATSGGRAGAKS